MKEDWQHLCANILLVLADYLWQVSHSVRFRNFHQPPEMACTMLQFVVNRVVFLNCQSHLGWYRIMQSPP